MIILYSAVLMGTSHSIRNKFYVIKGTAFRRQACFPFFFPLCGRFEPRSNFICRWNMFVSPVDRSCE